MVPPRPRWRRAAPVIALGLALAVAAGLLLPWRQPAITGIETLAAAAGEAEIAAHRAAGLTLFRLAANPRVLVLDFPDLAAQGRMLNRAAAFIEKVGGSRTHVLDDAALAAAIRADGATPETYYYGHDYRAADLARFLAAADRDTIALNADEERLRRLLRDIGWLAPGTIGAVIAVPGSEPGLDAAARASILRHEVAHGMYFTDPAYAAHVRAVWARLSEADRALLRGFLARDGYDAANEDLMMNESQAYLLHTPDPRHFTAGRLGTTPEHLAELRAAFAE